VLEQEIRKPESVLEQESGDGALLMDGSPELLSPVKSSSALLFERDER
jgi:hypothetical protein